MRVVRRRGRLQLRLESVEVSILTALFDELDGVLDGTSGDGAEDIRARLYPAGYRDDAEAEEEFRLLTTDTLRSDRNDRLAECRADLARDETVDLTSPDVARRWIQLLNDLRLALGTRLGIDEDEVAGFGAGEPQAELRAVYHWLTAMQDAVVAELLP